MWHFDLFLISCSVLYLDPVDILVAPNEDAGTTGPDPDNPLPPSDTWTTGASDTSLTREDSSIPSTDSTEGVDKSVSSYPYKGMSKLSP